MLEGSPLVLVSPSVWQVFVVPLRTSLRVGSGGRIRVGLEAAFFRAGLLCVMMERLVRMCLSSLQATGLKLIREI